MGEQRATLSQNRGLGKLIEDASSGLHREARWTRKPSGCYQTPSASVTNYLSDPDFCCLGIRGHSTWSLPNKHEILLSNY